MLLNLPKLLHLQVLQVILLPELPYLAITHLSIDFVLSHGILFSYCLNADGSTLSPM